VLKSRLLFSEITNSCADVIRKFYSITTLFSGITACKVIERYVIYLLHIINIYISLLKLINVSETILNYITLALNYKQNLVSTARVFLTQRLRE